MALFTRKPKPGPPAQGAPKNVSQTNGALHTHTTDPRVEQRTQEIGRDLLDRARAHKSGLLSARFYSDKLMDWAMKDHAFKVQLFRFVDAFPVLTTPDMVHDHLVDYLTQPGVKAPPGMELALKAGAIAKGITAKTISSQIKGMASNFIAGTDAADALPSLRKLWNDGIAFSVDLLGEACVSDEEADAYRDKYLDLVENLHAEAGVWPANERLERDHLGSIPRVNVSIKLSSLSAKCDPIDTDGAINDLISRLEPILTKAKANNVFINFDMESHALKDLTLECFMRCCERFDFDAGIAMQAYLRSGVADAKRLAEWSKRVGRTVSVRLVKGAYWDYETIHAEQEGWPCPVWSAKWQSDLCFEQMTDVILGACPRLANDPGLKLALGSHNVRSIAHALASLEAKGLGTDAIELQMLHGMADQLKAAATDMGLRVREYVPVGEMIPGMAYLVRRLLENTSNESWLKAGFLDNATPDVLLRPPSPPRGEGRGEGSASSPMSSGTGVPPVSPPSPSSPSTDLSTIAPDRHQLSDANPGVGDAKPFFTEPVHDFSRADLRKNFAEAIARANVPAVANDRTPDQGLAMIAKAHAAFPAWRDFDPIKRSDVLVRAAAKMRAKRDDLSAVIIKENGKDWRNADADVTEAIDFCEYYAREAPRLFTRERLGRFIGELDQTWHQPRGVALVISPWNFPLAICCGMTTAALVTGNTVVIKPAEQTPAIARLMHDILQEALTEVLNSVAPSLRRSVASSDLLHFCPAPGETTAAAMVRDPRVALIAFTGSKAVGLDIIQAAAHTPSSPPTSSRGTGVPPVSYPPSAYPQPHVKRVICEMGGKNAIIIDSSADLDEAVLAVRVSAFGFQGQKCSACSRCIVVDPEGPDGRATQTFLRRLVASTNSLVVGDPTKPGTDVGPVIDEEAATNIKRYIQIAKDEGCKLELEMQLPAANPYVDSSLRRFVAPTIFSHVTPAHTIYQQEIFGPVLAVTHAPDFDAALALANDHPYKLTGGVFTRKPAHIDQAKRDFRVGNLYINRPITGALVGRQPFGGFGMSGVGSKAGGREYLLQFVEPRACCENTMRRGFAPEL
ncbi:MAG: proline dehydrogenase family protein [Phycisphaerales bacterium]